MPNSLAEVSYQLRAVAVNHFSVLRALGNRASRVVLSIGDAQHGRPLLELLISALRPDKRVGQAMYNLHARTLALIPGIGIVHELSPLFWSVLHALSASLIIAERRRGCLRAGEAGKCSAGIGGSSLENVGISAHHYDIQSQLSRLRVSSSQEQEMK